MDEETIEVEEASRWIETLSKRIALLHLSYAKTLTEELGEERGKEISLKAIRRYGKHIGEARREEIEEKGLEPTAENFSKGESLSIPPFGMHSGVERDGEKMKAYGCVMGKFWRDMGEEGLGKLYCYVDPVKYLAYDDSLIQIDTEAMTAGDDHCGFLVRPSSEEEKEKFKEEKNLEELDEYLKNSDIV